MFKMLIIRMKTSTLMRVWRLLKFKTLIFLTFHKNIIADVLAKLRTTNSRLDKERSMCHALTKSPLNRNSLALQSWLKAYSYWGITTIKFHEWLHGQASIFWRMGHYECETHSLSSRRSFRRAKKNLRLLYWKINTLLKCEEPLEAHWMKSCSILLQSIFDSF